MRYPEVSALLGGWDQWERTGRVHGMDMDGYEVRCI